MIGRLAGLFGSAGQHNVYDVLPYLSLQLVVDVGAAAGHTSRRMRLAGDAGTQLVAFEPFPGNHPYFQASTRDLDNVTLIKKAVSDKVGTATFVVSSVVQGTEPGWERFPGYSSVGRLAEAAPPGQDTDSRRVRLKRAIASLLARLGLAGDPHSETATLQIETTTIDHEFQAQRIDFIKVDVQGGELRVLQGARASLANHNLRALYLEWTGDREIARLLAAHGYALYDSTYLAVPTAHDFAPFAALGFEFIRELDLSTGWRGFEMALTAADAAPPEILARAQAQGLGYVQTDLLAIAPPAQPAFAAAARKYRQLST